MDVEMVSIHLLDRPPGLQAIYLFDSHYEEYGRLAKYCRS